MPDTPQQAAAKSRAAARALVKANRLALVEAGRVTLPIMRVQAQRAAGGNRRLRNAGNALLAADWNVSGVGMAAVATMSPRGPWRLRDNSYTGGKTREHTIVGKNRADKLLIFRARDGNIVFTHSVQHPGSAREPFWSDGVQQAIPLVAAIVPRENFRAVAGAFTRPGSFIS
jgi:hypothetical protein